MLLRVDPGTKKAGRVRGVPLSRFGLNERDLQAILFASLDRLIGEDELLPVMQSRPWQEEPDLMALDREGRLHIFEVKVWEARSENLLQVLRYGQLYGALDHDGLDRVWRRTGAGEHSLAQAHAAAFGLAQPLAPEAFNRRQVFVVLTNGLDVDTRQAVRYWQSTGLDVRPWVYRVYEEGGGMLLEIAPYRIADDPLEDQAESLGDGYYVLNTNWRNSEQDDAEMLAERKAAAFFSPWKLKISRLKRGDVVFLYRSGVGVVAAGRANGKLVMRPYQYDPQYPDEEYNMDLTDFVHVSPPVTAAAMKSLTGNPGLVFRQTMFSLDPDGGAKLSGACWPGSRDGV